MAVSIQTSKQAWLRRPSGPAQINWGSPLARGLVHLHSGHTLRDAVSQTTLSFGSSVVFSSDLGLIRYYNGSTQDTAGSRIGAATSGTFALWVWNDPTLGSVFGAWWCGATAYNGSFFIGRNTASTNWQVYLGNSQILGTGIPTKTWVHLAVAFHGGGTALYVNGQLNNSDGVGRSVSSHTTYEFGGNSAGPYQSASAISTAWFWNRALSPAEIQSLYDPRTRWSLYAPQIRRTYFGTTTAPTGYTLSADTFSYVLAGTDVIVKVTRTFAADSGTYTFSGTNNSLTASRLVTGESGSYNFSGTDATVKANRLLAGDAGAFTFSGSDAVLKAARMIVGESGSFTLTGLDIALTYTPLTGYAPLIAENGTFVLSGTDIALKVSRKLQADAGAFTLAGTDVNLGKQYNLIAVSGDFVLTAEDVSFTKSSKLSAETGSYTLVGRNATLRYSGELSPERFIRLNSPLSDSLISILTKDSSSGTVTLTLSPTAPLNVGVTDSLKDE